MLFTAEIVFDLINLKVSGRGKSHGCEGNKKLHDDGGCKMTLRNVYASKSFYPPFIKNIEIFNSGNSDVLIKLTKHNLTSTQIR